jgi:hypothetical protein
VKKQKIRRTRRAFSNRKRRPKTFADVTNLVGNEYYQDPEGVTFRVEDTAYDHMITMGELLAKFYRLNEGQRPLVMRLIDEPSRLIRGEKIWQVIMRGNFYLLIESNQSHGGPHPTKLWFQTFGDKKNYWLASMQTMAFFFNEDQMREAIMVGVDSKEFFMLPANRDIAVSVEIEIK